MKVMVACEFSGTVRDAFLRVGHNAISCDLLPTSTPGPHIIGDIRDQDLSAFDLLIAFPPCTWLCQAMRTNAARKDRPNITPIFEQERQKAFDFCALVIQYSG